MSGNQTGLADDLVTERRCGDRRGDEWDMAILRGLGELERAVMDQLWDTDAPQTVREVHNALLADRELAYTTVMTVLQRLHCKDLVVQIRAGRAFRYAPSYGRDELVAGLMVDVLDQVSDGRSRQAALMRFVKRVGADEADALRQALAEVGKQLSGSRLSAAGAS